MCEMINLEIDCAREKRLMMFTSLLRTKNLVSHARVVQRYNLFNEFVKEYPLIDGYNTRTGQRVDHNNMKLFLENKGQMRLIEKKILRVLSDIDTPLTEKELYIRSFGDFMGWSEVEFKKLLESMGGYGVQVYNVSDTVMVRFK